MENAKPQTTTGKTDSDASGLVPNNIVLSTKIGDEFVLAEGIPYRISNKWHQDRSKPAFLDAESNHADGRIYRSHYHSDNTIWFLAKESDGAYSLQNKWHLDRNMTRFLNAPSDKQPNPVNRSTSNGDNSAWYIISMGDGSFRIQSKYFRSKEQGSLLDADSNEPSGRIYLSGFNSDNVCWYFQPVNYKLSAVVKDYEFINVGDEQISKFAKQITIEERRPQNDINPEASFLISRALVRTANIRFKNPSGLKLSIEVQVEFPLGTKSQAMLATGPSLNSEQQITLIETAETKLSKVKGESDSTSVFSGRVDYVEDLEAEFFALMHISASGERLRFEGAPIEDAKLDSRAVVSIVRSLGYTGELQTKGDAVFIPIKGVFKGSYPLQTE